MKKAARRTGRHVWGWLAAAGVVAAIALYVASSGVISWIVGGVVLLLLIDLMSGLHVITPFFFYRIVLPLVITVVILPFCFLWPGDPNATYWSNVRARIRSLGRMWLGYWGLDRG